ncbi:MAG TPA: MFS transporter [Nocardioides sp.]|uniref:MFS transporter n=1 Tax=Nocardioides sp. TaxID=35761 RepID=UPI002E350E10|nr:MFS transporter [Nocardioides sp.]HEX5089802.1 MFS transporter [Nocardioides sp.]
MLHHLRTLLLPSDHVERALTLSTTTAALSTGLFYTVSALYFTRVVGLAAATVGLGLTVAGGVGVAASFAGGYAADRVGADRLQLWGNAVQGLAFLAYVLAGSALAFTLVACVAVGARSLQSTAKATVQARWFSGPERVAIRARLRVVTNVFIGVGTVLAGVALLADSAAAFRATMVAVGVFATLATVPLARLRDRVPGFGARMDAHRAPDRVPGPSPMGDRTYLTLVALTSVTAMQFGIQTVGVPLWVATRTDAPTVVISALLVINTAFVAAFQVRAARGTDDVRLAGRTARRGSLLLAAACLMYGVTGPLGALVAVVVLVLAGLLGAWAEVWTEAGAWGLAFELADPASAGRYQGLFTTGYSLAGMVAPALVTATAVDHGLSGWAVLAVVFALAGVSLGALARRAADPCPGELALVA